jgi:hypothetical protein
MKSQLNHSALELQQFDAAQQSLVATIEGFAMFTDGAAACLYDNGGPTRFNAKFSPTASTSPAQR